jgi:hypothetical protein
MDTYLDLFVFGKCDDMGQHAWLIWLLLVGMETCEFSM